MTTPMAVLRPSPLLGHLHFNIGGFSCRKDFRITKHTAKIKALFWEFKKAENPPDTHLSIDSFTSTKINAKEESADNEKAKTVSVSVVSSILEVPSSGWDACCLDATGPEQFNPFLSHGHSYGEYVFDHSWADAYYRYGSRYYPKLQCCVPFTPVPGPRILLRNTSYKDQVFDILVSAMKDLAIQVSSLHITFSTENEWHALKDKGFLQRTGMQYHWKNRNYKDFDDFLMDMKQSKRKNIRQERKKIPAQNLKMKRLRGSEIKCVDVHMHRWGTPYLTREFFHIMGSKLGDKVMLIVAEEGDELVAGALNLIGGDTIYGRLWGCLPRVYYPSLHFEACYYQAIEAAIELNLGKVEAGAQGEHKIQRGYLPVTTYSCHYLLDEGFKQVIGNFLSRETDQVKLVTQLIAESGPFKDGII
ncbi:hypothetical protein M8C21_026120 [Ambrosia artemisiifolia]|uniref:Acyl-CoA N-acyltransferase n=1 Tax=Ambrosia artemisiifolia TaxID=4212 RepID=A0AAD5GXL6_AMBAR|nr:hypothetical protein M8C21_026120 [Ambrosia artemisiifolia]